MWIIKGSVRCPVCTAILGKLVTGRPSAYPCKECEWIFPLDADGKPLAPIKLNRKKPQGCGCESCKARDASKYIENL